MGGQASAFYHHLENQLAINADHKSQVYYNEKMLVPQIQTHIIITRLRNREKLLHFSK